VRFDLGVAFEEYRASGQLVPADSVEQAVQLARRALEDGR
jgi:hypothetical protein